MKEIVNILDKAINDLNAIRRKREKYSVFYNVVKLDTSGCGTETIQKIPFECVDDAIECHLEKIKENLMSSYWDIVVDYVEDE